MTVIEWSLNHFQQLIMVLMNLRRLNLEEIDYHIASMYLSQLFQEYSINGYHTWARSCHLSFDGLDEMNFEKRCQCHLESF